MSAGLSRGEVKERIRSWAREVSGKAIDLSLPRMTSGQTPTDIISSVFPVSVVASKELESTSMTVQPLGSSSFMLGVSWVDFFL